MVGVLVVVVVGVVGVVVVVVVEVVVVSAAITPIGATGLGQTVSLPSSHALGTM